MNKESAIETLQSLKNDENSEKIDKFISKIENLSEENWQGFLNINSISDGQDIKNLAKLYAIRNDKKHTPLNDLISYGKTGSTLHIHIIPKRVKSKFNVKDFKEVELSLIDSMGKLKELMSNEHVDATKVKAVSKILGSKHIMGLFKNLDFDTKVLKTEDAKSDKDLGVFYHMFKNTPGKRIGMANISKEKLFSKEWEELVNNRKDILEKELKSLEDKEIER